MYVKVLMIVIIRIIKKNWFIHDLNFTVVLLLFLIKLFSMLNEFTLTPCSVFDFKSVENHQLLNIYNKIQNINELHLIDNASNTMSYLNEKSNCQKLLNLEKLSSVTK